MNCATTPKQDAARLRGYNDRIAHRKGETNFGSEAERTAYEAGVGSAECAMGFSKTNERPTSWERGWMASDDGAGLSENPFSRWTVEYEGWRNGWLAHQDTIRLETHK